MKPKIYIARIKRLYNGPRRCCEPIATCVNYGLRYSNGTDSGLTFLTLADAIKYTYASLWGVKKAA